MAFLSVNLAGIGFYSWRRGAPSPRGENFGAAMNARTKTDYGKISTRPVSTLRASLGVGGVLGCFRAFPGVPVNPDGFGARPDDMGRSPSYAGAYCVARGAILGAFWVLGACWFSF